MSLRPEHSEEHLSKLSLPLCPDQPWLKAQASQGGGKSVCSTEERQLPSNTPIFRREIPHISFPALKGGQRSATCKHCQTRFGFYTDKCKYSRSMYPKTLKKPEQENPPNLT